MKLSLPVPRFNFTAHIIRLGAALGLIGLLLLPLPAQADGALLRVDPPALYLIQNQVKTLTLVLENAQEVYGLSVKASFDPAVVEVVDADPVQAGLQMTPGPFLKPDFLVLNTADNQTGALEFVVTQTNPSPPVSGTGVVLAIQFRGKSPATQSPFTITAVDIVNRQGTKLSVESQNGAFEVAASGAPGTNPVFLPLILTHQQPLTSDASAAVSEANPAPINYDYARVSGSVVLQGHAAPDASSTVTLTDLDNNFAPTVVNIDPATGNFTASVPVLPGGTTYQLEASHALYVSGRVTQRLAPNNNYPAVTITPKGGDADNNGKIETDDLVCISQDFGDSPGSCGDSGSSDINNDGVVNILDLVLAGANFMQTP